MAFKKFYGKNLFALGGLLLGQGPVRSLVTAIDGATVTFDTSKADTFKVTLAGNRTFAVTNGTIGQRLVLHVIQDATGSRTVTWPANVKLSGGAVTLTTTAAKTDSFMFVYDGTNWREVSRSLNS